MPVRSNRSICSDPQAGDVILVSWFNFTVCQLKEVLVKLLEAVLLIFLWDKGYLVIVFFLVGIYKFVI